MPSTAVVVDDHPAFRASARRLLELSGFEVVGEAADGPDALALVQELEPELVLLDVALPGMSGLEVAKRLAGTRSRVVLISSRQSPDFGKRVRESGAIGFVSKDDLSNETLADVLRRSR